MAKHRDDDVFRSFDEMMQALADPRVVPGHPYGEAVVDKMNRTIVRERHLPEPERTVTRRMIEALRLGKN